MRRDQDRQWRSGAALALVAAFAGLTAHLSLRAASENALPLWALAVGGAALALALWPLAARTSSVAALTLILALAQFGTRALVVLASGQAGSDPRSLVCCPPADQIRSGPLGALTAQAGWALAAAQLIACLLVALAVRGGRAAADLNAAALRLAHGVLERAGSRLAGLLIALRHLVPTVPAGPARRSRPTPARALDAGRVLARRTRRRGPPAGLPLSPAWSRAIVAPRSFLPAAG